MSDNFVWRPCGAPIPGWDDFWRIVARYKPTNCDPYVDGKDCYLFQRRDPDNPLQTLRRIMLVERFWESK